MQKDVAENSILSMQLVIFAILVLGCGSFQQDRIVRRYSVFFAWALQQTTHGCDFVKLWSATSSRIYHWPRLTSKIELMCRDMLIFYHRMQILRYMRWNQTHAALSSWNATWMISSFWMGCTRIVPPKIGKRKRTSTEDAFWQRDWCSKAQADAFKLCFVYNYVKCCKMNR